MTKFRPGYLEQGNPLGATAICQAMIADATNIDCKKVGLLRLTSDSATATDRTFTLHDGAKMGHQLTIVFESSSYACELASSGNVKLANGITWLANAAYDSLQLQWNGTYWVELGRSSGSGYMRTAQVTVTAAQLVSSGTGVAYVSGPVVPDNAIVHFGLVDVTTTFVGDGDDSSTLSVGIEDQDNDLVVAIAISDVSNPWDIGIHAMVPVGTAATSIKLTAARQLAVTWDAIATDTTLSAGSMNVIVYYTVANI